MSEVNFQEFIELQSNFYTLQAEFYNFKNKMTDEYDYESPLHKIHDLEGVMTELQNELQHLNNEIYENLRYQHALDLYYLEHKENYDKEFNSISELTGFLMMSIFHSAEAKFNISKYDKEYIVSYGSLYTNNKSYTFNNNTVKDFLICVSSFESSTGIKFCINSEELTKSIKEQIFNDIMLNNTTS